MPRYRAIYIVWLLGLVLLVGVWMRSVRHESVLYHLSASGKLRALIVSGGGVSFESRTLGPHLVPGLLTPGWSVDTSAHQYAETTFLGRFRWGDAFSKTGRGYELPFWFLIALFTLLCVPFLLRANRKYNQARAAGVASHRSQRDRS